MADIDDRNEKRGERRFVDGEAWEHKRKSKIS
jgi:hypothetical protein